MVNKVRVNIAGTPYAIATTDSEKYILGLAKKLDEDITKLLDTNDNLSVTKAAVFCAGKPLPCGNSWLRNVSARPAGRSAPPGLRQRRHRSSPPRKPRRQRVRRQTRPTECTLYK